MKNFKTTFLSRKCVKNFFRGKKGKKKADVRKFSEIWGGN